MPILSTKTAAEPSVPARSPSSRSTSKGQPVAFEMWAPELDDYIVGQSAILAEYGYRATTKSTAVSEDHPRRSPEIYGHGITFGGVSSARRRLLGPGCADRGRVIAEIGEAANRALSRPLDVRERRRPYIDQFPECYPSEDCHVIENPPRRGLHRCRLPCVAFNNNPESTKSFDYVRAHNEAVNRLDVILGREEITADYAPGTVETVVQHDGSVLRLRKLAPDYDPCDRISALTYLQQHHAAGEVVTGLLFVEPNSGDMHEFLDTVEAPLNALGERELCPGPEALARFNAAHR